MPTKSIIRIITGILLMLCSLGLASLANANGAIHGNGSTTEFMATEHSFSNSMNEERNGPEGYVSNTSLPMHRLGSVRNTRVLNFHGNGGRGHSQTACKNSIYSLTNPLIICFHPHHLGWKHVPSPRLNYVIALERFLC